MSDVRESLARATQRHPTTPRTARLSVSDLDYHLLPGEAPSEPTAAELHGQACEFWQTFWSAELAAHQAFTLPLDREDLLRQNFITVLTQRSSVVGLHAYSLWNSENEPLASHAYFRKYFPPAAIDRLSALGMQRLMSMEYWSVAFDWRPARTRISLGVILALLGLRLAIERGVDAVVTAVRADRGGANVAFDTGARPLHESIRVFSRPTELVYWTPDSIRPSKHLLENAWAETLWTQRMNHTHYTHCT